MKKGKILSIAIVFIMFSINSFASLSVHPQKLTITVNSGQIASTNFHITNVGPSGNLSYQLNASDSWVSFNSVAGNINLKDTANIEMKIDATKLINGIYNTNITIGDPHHGLITVPVEIYVNTVSDVYDYSENNNFTLLVFPNPFVSTTEINYYLIENQNVTLDIFNINGVLVKSLVNEFQSKGNQHILLNDSEMPSGIYLLTLKTNSNSVVKKLFINK